MTDDAAMKAATPREASTSERLRALAAAAAPASRVTLGWILEQLHERAFGLFLLILALPCCIPFLYGVPQIVALPLLFISGQLALGRRTPWLPERLSRREIDVASLAALAERAAPYLQMVERVSGPRLGFLTRPPLDRIVAIALLLFSTSILVPLPGTNTVPGVAVALIALGFLGRDGLLILVGTALGSAWITGLLLAGAGLAVWVFG